MLFLAGNDLAAGVPRFRGFWHMEEDWASRQRRKEGDRGDAVGTKEQISSGSKKLLEGISSHNATCLDVQSWGEED